MRRPNPNDKLLERALKNGATVEGIVPKKLQPRAPKAPHEGEFIHRLMRCAALGWGWIETDDALRYRWRTADGAKSVWGSYDEITKITFGP